MLSKGDKVEVMADSHAGSKYFSVGDVGIVETIETDGTALVNFTAHNNLRVYGDGRWFVRRRNLRTIQAVAPEYVRIDALERKVEALLRVVRAIPIPNAHMTPELDEAFRALKAV